MATPTERSVDWLQRLYAIVIGLALTEGLRNAFLNTNPTASFQDKVFRPETWAIVALVVTIIPFFHGANRHLDNVYIFKAGAAKDFALLLDFIFFFLHGTIFYWMALAVKSVFHFFTIYSILLFVDVIWGVAVFFYTESGWKGTKRWVLINLITFIVAWMLMNTPLLGADNKPHALGALAVLRSILDYALQWKFYYP